MTYQMFQRKEFPPLLICLHQLLQSISKSRNSYLKDTTDFINYTFEKKVKIEHFLFRLTGHKSWQLHHKTRAFKQFAEGINFCKFKTTLLFLNTLPAGNANRLILIKRTFFIVQWKPPPHSTAMSTKTAVSFANIFMAYIGTRILSKPVFKPTVWKPQQTTGHKSDSAAEFLRASKFTAPYY